MGKKARDNREEKCGDDRKAVMFGCEEIDKFRWVLLALALHNDIIIILNRNSAAEVSVAMYVCVCLCFFLYCGFYDKPSLIHSYHI